MLRSALELDAQYSIMLVELLGMFVECTYALLVATMIVHLVSGVILGDINLLTTSAVCVTILIAITMITMAIETFSNGGKWSQSSAENGLWRLT